MGNTGTTLATIVLFASMNNGNVIRTIDSDMLPTCNATYHHTQDISNWRENAFNTYSNKIPNNRDSLKLEIIIAFGSTYRTLCIWQHTYTQYTTNKMATWFKYTVL